MANHHERITGHRHSRGIGRRSGALLFLMVMVGGLLMSAAPAGAHRIDQSYVYLDIYDETIEGRLEFNVSDINDTFDSALPTDQGDVPAIEAAVEAFLPTLLEYADTNFDLGTEGEVWDVEFRGTFELIGSEAGLFVILPYVVNETFTQLPTTVDVRYEAFVLDNENHNAFVHIGNYWEGGVLANEADFLLILNGDRTFDTFDLENPDFFKGLVNVVELGIDHIRIGTDHIMFVVALLLPSVLVFSTAWQPAASFRVSLWRVLKIATTFTLAHSITLSLAGFGIIELPSKPVETIIAISIVLAALHNFRPIFVNREWVLAFAFGLFHGLGFAGLLSELGLDRTNRVWSLFAFNLGVEIGQAALIILLFPLLYLLRRTLFFEKAFKAASGLLAFVASLWAVERFFEVDLKVNKAIDPLVEVPRAYFVIAAATLAAAAWRHREAERGRLIPIDEPATPDPARPPEDRVEVGV